MQVFRVRETQMQYCFGYTPGATTPREQSPFSVNSTSENSVSFCWREGLPGMQTHAKDCRGCDCAAISISIPDPEQPDSAELTFWQSPPVIHAHLELKRAGPAPNMAKIEQTLPKPYALCNITDECLAWQFCPNKGGDDKGVAAAPQRPAGCLAAAAAQALKARKKLALEEPEGKSLAAPPSAKGTCFQLNGDNLLINNILPKALRYDVPDIKLLVQKPDGPCSPCRVNYAVSAALTPNQYVAVGFKGQSWEGETPTHPATKRPCYFGMCVDNFDNFTSDRIALGYATPSHGACVREMVSADIVGEPSDADYKIMRDTTVERQGQRTIMRFSLDQHWPTVVPTDGFFRVMWAVGDVSGAQGCNATAGFHGIHRGVAPLNWLQINSRPCTFDGGPDEM